MVYIYEKLGNVHLLMTVFGFPRGDPVQLAGCQKQIINSECESFEHFLFFYSYEISSRASHTHTLLHSL